MKTTIGRAKYYLLFALVFVALLGIVSALWDTSSEKKNRPFTIKSTTPIYDPARLPPKTSTQSNTQLVKKDIKGPIQGKVTIIDWCSRTVYIDDVLFNMGSLDLTGIETGDRVKLTYEDTRQGKVIESIHMLR
jgi:hypothetical protein